MRIFSSALTLLPILFTTVYADTVTEVNIIDPPVVYMVDIEPKGRDMAIKGAMPLNACAPAWEHPYLSGNTSEADFEKQLRHFNADVLAESRFSTPDQIAHMTALYKASLEGNLSAMTEIADRYYDGNALPNNFKASFLWYLRAAELGSPYAMYMLSELYANGWIVEQDARASGQWYFRAQAAPNALLGMRQLAQRYANHEGGLYILTKAFFWYERAGSHGDAQSQLWMGDYYANVEHLDGLLALKWYGRAAAQNEPQAYYGIAQLYELGRGIPIDYRQAFNWYQKAADQGLNVAQYHVGEMYAMGKGVAFDPVRAWAWLEVSRSKQDNDRVESLQHEILADMLPEQRLQAADLAARLELHNQGDHRLAVDKNDKLKKVAPKKVAAKPKPKSGKAVAIQTAPVIEVDEIMD